MRDSSRSFLPGQSRVIRTVLLARVTPSRFLKSWASLRAMVACLGSTCLPGASGSVLPVPRLFRLANCFSARLGTRSLEHNLYAGFARQWSVSMGVLSNDHLAQILPLRWTSLWVGKPCKRSVLLHCHSRQKSRVELNFHGLTILCQNRLSINDFSSGFTTIACAIALNYISLLHKQQDALYHMAS